MYKKTIPLEISYISLVYFLGLLVFSIFRLIIVFSNLHQIPDMGLLIKALFMGFRFDSVVIGYIILIPTLFLFANYWLQIKNRYFFNSLHYFTITFFCLSFLICSIDIPYFNYFFARFTIVGFAWIDSPKFVLGMLFQEWKFLIFLIIFLVVCSGFVFIMYKIKKVTLKKLIKEKQCYKLKTKILYSLAMIFCLGFIFLGIRGRITKKSPIKVGTAYFCDNSFLNLLGLNPNFTLFKSWEESMKSANKPITLIDPKDAKHFVEKELGINETSEKNLNDNINKKNLVIVIMESMSADRVGHFNKNIALTPNIDSLIANSFSFESTYTAGIHTYNGVFSTLFSIPAIFNRHSMNRTIIPKINGASSLLKKYGYSTFYFTTHDDQFDNIGGFLTENDFDNIIAQKDYSFSEVKSTLGVPDHIMFDRVIKELNNKTLKKPFLATILTSSLHGPYIFPDDIPIKPTLKDIVDNMLLYSDWAIGEFIAKVKKCAWFDNTIFVFIADHGANLGTNNYDIPLSYHHTPFFIYSPKNIKPGLSNKLALQIDLMPTALHLLNATLENQSLGINLFNRNRKYAYFSADDKIGVLDSTFFYIWNKNGNEGLYFYKENSKENLIKSYPQKVMEMKNYAFSMIQYAQNF